MSDEDEAIFYITKDEFIKRMLLMNKDWTFLANKYVFQMENAKKDEDAEWFEKELKELTDDIRHNNEMIARAKLEEGYNLFWADSNNSLNMRRCSKKEFDVIYKMKRKIDYVI